MATPTTGKTPAEKGVRTFFQTAAATVVAFLYGLWQLPGVSDYVNNFVQTQGLSLLLGLIALIGVPAGVIAYLQNRAGK
jgi:hypothetical protein